VTKRAHRADNLTGGGVMSALGAVPSLVKRGAGALLGLPSSLAGLVVGNLAVRSYVSGRGSLSNIVPSLPNPPSQPFALIPARTSEGARTLAGMPTPKSMSRAECANAVSLAPYQVKLVKRFTAQCRDLPGGLFLHRMGSGKTLSALALLHNLPPNGRRIVLSPAGITSNFEFVRDESKSTSELMRNDIFKMYPSQAAAEQRARGLQIVTYTPKAGYDSLADLLAGRTSTGVPLEDFFAGAYVVADEAHNLLRFMPNEAQRQRVVAALQRARRIYLMTGTPIIGNMSDLGRLVGLVARMPPSVMPVEDNAFKARFFHLTRSGFMKQVGTNLVYQAYSVAAKALLMSLSINLMPAAVAAYVGASLPVWGKLLGAVSALAQGAASNAGGMAIEAGSGMFVFAVHVMLQKYIASKEYRELNADKLVAEVSKYITFFDYELEAPADQLNFPKKSVVSLGVPYTQVQARLLTRMLAPRMLTDDDRDAMDMEPSESPSNEDTFFKYARAVGNASDDWYRYTTRWSKRDQCWQAVRIDGTRGPDTRYPFECPKFAAAARLLVEHAVHGNPRMTETQPRYLPVVYSSFDELGFRRFGAYLTARGLKYLTFHEADAPAHRAKLLQRANEVYPNAPAAALQDARAVGDTPVCVLLHPAITEGLSFTDAPSIIVLEIIDGYGVQEQVYGRILRRYPVPFVSQAARATKTIYQMCGEWPPFAEATLGGLKEYLVQYNGGLTGVWQVSLYRDKFAVKTPEVSTIQKNEEQRALLDLLATAFQRNDDAAQGALCDAQRGGRPVCQACVRGDCDCTAATHVGIPLCPDVPESSLLHGGGFRHALTVRPKKRSPSPPQRSPPRRSSPRRSSPRRAHKRRSVSPARKSGSPVRR
jgi:hypothetical protein